jgi:hypothetical protein
LALKIALGDGVTEVVAEVVAEVVGMAEVDTVTPLKAIT